MSEIVRLCSSALQCRSGKARGKDWRVGVRCRRLRHAWSDDVFLRQTAESTDLLSVSLGQPTVKAGYMESPDPRGGAEGTEERVLALHTEKPVKEIDESASDVVVCGMARRCSLATIGGEQRSPVSLGQPPLQLVTWRSLPRVLERKAPLLPLSATSTACTKFLERIVGKLGYVRVALEALDVESLPARSNCLGHRYYAFVELGIGMHFHRWKYY